jgi:putative ABC transport system permease protein
MTPVSAPRLAERLMERVFRSPAQRHGIVGDLREEYARRRAQRGRIVSDIWFWQQAVLVYWRFKAEARKTTPATRGGSGMSLIGDLVFDLRFAVRSLLKRPLFTAVAVLTVGLGIGATTAVFSVVDGVLLSPLPFPESERLLSVSDRDIATEDTRGWVTFPIFQHWNEHQDLFESFAAYGTNRGILNFGESAEQVRGAAVSAGFFGSLGVAPLLGRGFRPEEDDPGSAGVIVLGYGLWQDRFGGDRDVLGRTLTVDEKTYTVVGVMPQGFAFPSSRTRYWVPMADAIRNANTWYLQMVGRLNSGLTQQNAIARASTLLRVDEDPGEESADYNLHLTSLKDRVIGADVGSLLLIFATAVIGVLLIAGTNVASLLLSRSATRRPELTVRAALGASRWRLARMLLAETMSLSVCGALVGTVLAVVLTRCLLWFETGAIPRQTEIGIDLGALGFSMLLALVLGCLMGLFPALRFSRPDLGDGLSAGSKAVSGGGRDGRVRDALVVSQIALAFVLMVGSGLLVNSLVRLWTSPTGFDTEGVLVVGLTLPGSPSFADRYASHDRRDAFYRELKESLALTPAIESAALVSWTPMSGGNSSTGLEIENVSSTTQGRIEAGAIVVTPDYFATLGVPVLRGREFNNSDGPATPAVAIVDETFAQRYLPGQDPLGKRIRSGSGQWRTIVGVAGESRQRRLSQEHLPQIYMEHSQSEDYWNHHSMHLLVRASSDPQTAASTIRTVVAAIDPGVPVSSVSTMQNQLWNSISDERFLGVVVSFFGVAALLLAVVGVYAVLSYAVARRTREIGIRMALGAKRQKIIWQITGRGLVLATIGLGIGSVGAYWGTGLLQSYLFGVGTHDVFTFCCILVLLIVAALAASLVPALRASRVDPTLALVAE